VESGVTGNSVGSKRDQNLIRPISCTIRGREKGRGQEGGEKTEGPDENINWERIERTWILSP